MRLPLDWLGESRTGPGSDDAKQAPQPGSARTSKLVVFHRPGSCVIWEQRCEIEANQSFSQQSQATCAHATNQPWMYLQNLAERSLVCWYELSQAELVQQTNRTLYNDAFVVIMWCEIERYAPRRIYLDFSNIFINLKFNIFVFFM